MHHALRHDVLERGVAEDQQAIRQLGPAAQRCAIRQKLAGFTDHAVNDASQAGDGDQALITTVANRHVARSIWAMGGDVHAVITSQQLPLFTMVMPRPSSPATRMCHPDPPPDHRKCPPSCTSQHSPGRVLVVRGAYCSFPALKGALQMFAVSGRHPQNCRQL